MQAISFYIVTVDAAHDRLILLFPFKQCSHTNKTLKKFFHVRNYDFAIHARVLYNSLTCTHAHI